jgi:uncharacterized membrane protein YcgQ (UPF0703/DUF1980 family)
MNPARLVQSIGWMAFLGLLLIGGGYASYIASWQQWVLIAATALFGLLVLIDALVNRPGQHHDHEHHDHDHGTATDQWVQTLVHLLPLFLFLTMGVTTLGSQSLTSLTHAAPHSVLSSRHASGAPDVPTAQPAPTPTTNAPTTSAPAPTAPTTTTTPSATPAATQPPGKQTAQPTTPTPTAVTDPAVTPATILVDGPTPAEPTAAPVAAKDPALPAAVPLPLMELYYPKKHPGVTRVEVIGRLMIPTAEELAKVPPEMDKADLKLLLYRYVMTCCAADAAPVFVVLRGREPDGLKVDDWVKITGTWIPAPNLGDMVKLSVDSLTLIEQPAEPFLQAPKE